MSSHFLPQAVDMLYTMEPELKAVSQKALRQKRKGFRRRLSAYETAKHEAQNLVGWFARDPRLRSSGAWDCFFDYVLEELRL